MSKPDDLDGASAQNRATFFVDADGKRTDDPAKAVGGEIVELNGAPSRMRRTWFLVAREAEIKWLPVGESAFLLWVLAALLAVWLAAGFAFGLI